MFPEELTPFEECFLEEGLKMGNTNVSGYSAREAFTSGGLTSPLRYNRSKANRHTRTFTSSALTSFLFRLLSSWNGKSFIVSRSNATASVSSTKDLVLSLIA